MIDVVFGHRWENAAPVIRILSAVGLLFVLQGLNSTVLQAVNHTGVLFRYACISFAASLISFLVGLHSGIVGVAACFAVVSAIMQPIYLHLTARAVGVTMLACARNLAGVVQASLAAVLTAIAIHELLISNGAAAPARLAITAVVAAAVYVPACLWRVPDVLEELKRIRLRRTRSGGAQAVTA